jgi:hypothetical protein
MQVKFHLNGSGIFCRCCTGTKLPVWYRWKYLYDTGKSREKLKNKNWIFLLFQDFLNFSYFLNSKNLLKNLFIFFPTEGIRSHDHPIVERLSNHWAIHSTWMYEWNVVHMVFSAFGFLWFLNDPQGASPWFFQETFMAW